MSQPRLASVTTVVSILVVLLVGTLALWMLQTSRSSERERARIVDRVERLTERIGEFDAALLELQRRERSSSTASASASDLDAALREITSGAQYFEELAFHVELLLEALAAAGSVGTGPIDRSSANPPTGADLEDHLAHLEMLSERSREIRAERLRQFEATNRQLRHRWIRSMGRDLGFSANQEERVVELYDRQSSQWSALYERMSSDGLVHSEVADEMRRIREQTDHELELILGAELKERFRSGESLRFPAQQQGVGDSPRR